MEEPESLRAIYEKTDTPYKHRILLGILVDDKSHDRTIMNVLSRRGWRYAMGGDLLSLLIGLRRDRKHGIALPKDVGEAQLVEDLCRIWFKAFEKAGKFAVLDLGQVYGGVSYISKLYRTGDELGVFELVRAYAEHDVPVEDLVG